MTSYYDEIEIEDLEFNEETTMFYYECPCGDKFEISLDDLLNGDDIAHCPSCSLILKVIYDIESLEEKYLIDNDTGALVAV
jgi:hypothetical protein